MTIILASVADFAGALARIPIVASRFLSMPLTSRNIAVLAARNGCICELTRHPNVTIFLLRIAKL